MRFSNYGASYSLSIFTITLYDYSGNQIASHSLTGPHILGFTAKKPLNTIFPGWPAGGYNLVSRIDLTWQYQSPGKPDELTFWDMTVANVSSVTPTSLAIGSINPGPFCPGTALSVPYTASGFTAGNTFTAQLSDASGSFASPVNIGSITTIISNTISATIPANIPAGTGYRLRVVASSPAVTSTDNGSNRTVSLQSSTLSGTPGAAQTCATATVLASSTDYSAACSPIARIVPGGAAPVSGSVSTCVKVEASVPALSGQPYVARHYDIRPATNAATATATVTLYFTQAEFADYNAVRGTYPSLPTSAADPENYRSNLRITKFSGSSSDGSSNINTYTGSRTLITPASVVYNGNYWEVTFPVAGFSGFAAHTGSSILPVSLLQFSGAVQGDRVVLQWSTAQEENSAYTVVERSTDGGTFTEVGRVQAAGNSTTVREYGYTDPVANIAATVLYYRLKMVDKNDNVAYSKVVKVDRNTGFVAELLTNPFYQQIALKITSGATTVSKLVLVDAQGRTVLEKQLVLQKGTNAVVVPAANLTPGIYLLTVQAGNGKQTMRLVRQ
jgi:hypothetical protein